MRINLVTPFAEKDAAKALGARWDSAKKTWYVQNVADLAPFQRWIPATADVSAQGSAPVARRSPAGVAGAPTTTPGKGTVTESVTVLAHCGCAVLPWDPCTHHA